MDGGCLRKMPESTLFQNLLAAIIIIVVVGGVVVVYWAKATKQKPGQLLKQLSKVKLYNEEQPQTEEPKLKSQQIWQERRTIM